MELLLFKTKRCPALALLLLLYTSCKPPTTQAKRYVVRPLSASEVYLLLYEAGRLDAVPEGRFVTQGLAAIGSLATGLTRRITGAGTRGTAIRTQEICFDTRQARSLADAEALMETVLRAEHQGVRRKQRVRGSEVGRILKLKRRKKLREAEQHKGNKRIKNQGTQYMSMPSMGSRTGTSTDTGTADTPTYSSPASTSLTSHPGTTAAATGTSTTQTTNPATTLGTDEGEGTTSTFTTETSPEGAINCIVIKKNE